MQNDINDTLGFDLNDLETDTPQPTVRSPRRALLPRFDAVVDRLLRLLLCIVLLMLLGFAAGWMDLGGTLLALLQGLADFPRLLPLLGRAAVGLAALLAICAAGTVAVLTAWKLLQGCTLQGLAQCCADAILAVADFFDLSTLDEAELTPPQQPPAPEEGESLPADLDGLLDDLLKMEALNTEPTTRIRKGA